MDLGFLARRFKVSGGNIKNIALLCLPGRGQRRPMDDMLHLLHAIRREYQKMGKQLTMAEPGQVRDASSPRAGRG